MKKIISTIIFLACVISTVLTRAGEMMPYRPDPNDIRVLEYLSAPPPVHNISPSKSSWSFGIGIGPTLKRFFSQRTIATPCFKHQKPVQVTSTKAELQNKIKEACCQHHAAYPQNTIEAIAAAHQAGTIIEFPDGSYSNTPSYHYDALAPHVVTLEDAYRLPLNREQMNAQLGGLPSFYDIQPPASNLHQDTPLLMGESTLSQLTESTASNLLLSGQPVQSAENNQATHQAPLETVKPFPITHQEVVAATDPILDNIKACYTTIAPEQRGVACKHMQEHLIDTARNAAQVGDVASVENALTTCNEINQITKEAGSCVYTKEFDVALCSIMQLRKDIGLIKGTQLDKHNPELAAQLLAGTNNQRVQLASQSSHLWEHQLDPRVKIAFEGIVKGASNAVGNVLNAVLHPVDTVKKLALTAGRVIDVGLHFGMRDAHLQLARDLISESSAFLSISDELRDYWNSAIDAHIEANKHIPTACETWQAIKQLSMDDITTMSFQALDYISSEQGIAHISESGAEIVTSVLIGKGVGLALDNASTSLGGLSDLIPMHTELSLDGASLVIHPSTTTEVLAEAAAIAAETAAAASAATKRAIPAAQLASKMDSNKPLQGSTENIPTKVEIFEKNAKHIFRNSEGHLSVDTPENRKLLLDLASDMKNYLGTTDRGHQWFGRILPDGRQLWAEVRENMIRNGGVNKIPNVFNPKTGLSRLSVKK